MFSFLNPLFVWAAAAALLPLLLHLMQRRRVVRMPFSTIRFLQAAQRRSSRQIRIENFLLWLLRTLLMLLLPLAFAMPLLRTHALGGLLGRARRDVAVVLDVSYSMGYIAGRETAWDRARDCALAIVNGLQEGDRVSVFLADDLATPLVEQLTADRPFVVSQLQALSCGTTSCRLAPAAQAAYAALLAEARRREREVHIVTDGQALPWTSFAEGRDSAGAGGTAAVTGEVAEAAAPEAGRPAAAGTGAPWQPDKIDKRTAFFVTLTGVASPENVAPADVEHQPPLLMAGTPSLVKVRLARTGTAAATTVSAEVDGEEVGRRAAALGGDSGEVVVPLPPLEPGVHAICVETPPDSLPADDRFFVLVRAHERLPVLCAGGGDDLFFLLKALAAGAGERALADVKTIAADAVAEESLSDYSAVFLCNAFPLSGQAVLRLDEYVRTGGLLAVFPGNRAVPGDYEALACLPGLPVAAEDVTPSARTRVLVWASPRHPLVRQIRPGADAIPALTVARELRWERLPPETQVLLAAGADHPFLLLRPLSRGAALLFSVAADRSWSSFPLSPYFLPVLREIVQYGAGGGRDLPYLWTARSLSLADCLPAAGPDSTLLAPDGRPVAVRGAVHAGRTILRAENVLAAGIYALRRASNREPQPALAVNLDRAESNLTPVQRERLPAILGLRNVFVADGRDELERLLSEHRVGRTFGEAILWAALALAALEVCYANRRARRARTLSESLTLDASGRVRAVEHAHP